MLFQQLTITLIIWYDKKLIDVYPFYLIIICYNQFYTRYIYKFAHDICVSNVFF